MALGEYPTALPPMWWRCPGRRTPAQVSRRCGPVACAPVSPSGFFGGLCVPGRITRVVVVSPQYSTRSWEARYGHSMLNLAPVVSSIVAGPAARQSFPFLHLKCGAMVISSGQHARFGWFTRRHLTRSPISASVSGSPSSILRPRRLITPTGPTRSPEAPFGR